MYVKLIIGLCAYNNESGLINGCISNLIKILNYTNLFSLVHVVFYYDNSTDKTLPILKSFKEEYPNNVFIIENTKPKTNVRTKNIANARNGILHFIKENKEQYNYNYFAMMDCNYYSCIGEINLHILDEIFKESTKWNSVSFMRDAGYYDHWALSCGPYIYSMFHFTNSTKCIAMFREYLKNDFFKSHENTDFMPVYSAFNGFAVYDMDYFIDCKYSDCIDISLFPNNSIETHINTVGEHIINYFEGDCEHRYFHLESIKKHNSKIMIFNKSLFTKTTEPNTETKVSVRLPFTTEPTEPNTETNTETKVSVRLPFFIDTDNFLL